MANLNKVCFITCVNDESTYERCLNHIRALHVPVGMQAEVIAIREAASMAAGYNAAIKATEAAYKVYLHQDTFILNRAFIASLIDLFRTNERLGMLGVVGAGKVPESGIWWEAANRYGKVIEYRHTYGYLNFQEFEHNLRLVEAIDGLLIATQYDIPWREDLFTGWHLYDTSQCYEFLRQGYQVGVPRQDVPWVLHACGNEFDSGAYDQYRRIFQQEYLSEQKKDAMVDLNG